ncbi:MAG: GNAT family N-acetyltransferase [Chloroflexi bacterium]|nr:GNAT family N-acetyltransferase [Chloroflexota bacterium]
MEQTKVFIRTAVPHQDYEALAALLSKFWHEPISAQNIHDWDNIGGNDRILHRLLLENEQNQLLGYGLVRHQSHEADGWFYIWAGIDPAHRHQGLGQMLYNTILQITLDHNAAELGTDVLDDCPEYLRFAQKQGFILDRHLYESAVDLHTFDETPFAGLIEAVEAAGIRFTSLAAEGDTEEARRRLHALNRACSLDDPASNGVFPDFTAFNETWNNVSWFIPEGQLLALDGERYVGLAAVGVHKETNSMYNLITGVDRVYRGRKIAQALKLQTIHFAKAFGADTISTHNDSQNGPMLAINRKLGYQPRPGEYQLVKKL